MAEFQSFGSINGVFGGCLSDRDRGFAYGDGLFETMRLEQGRLPLFQFHHQRLVADSQRLQLSFDSIRLAEYLDDILAEVARQGILRAVVKVVVTRGEGGRGYQPAEKSANNIVIRVHPFPEYPSHYWSEGVSAFICEHRLGHNPRLAGIKHLNKLDHVLATLEWRDTENAEGILLDCDGNVVEACSRNIFAVKSSTLLTPSLHSAGVAGILRKRILEDYAGKLGLAVEEVAFDMDELFDADEIFLTNSVSGVWPVKQLHDKTGVLGSKALCRVAGQMQAMFDDDLRASRK
ncbi:aminodeoxychorismate lyase [Proteobacteria bacterium 005FR1]|nr:aminodeoxychorismate lyase [Proteobacteria bacterium 005FR1]